VIKAMLGTLTHTQNAPAELQRKQSVESKQYFIQGDAAMSLQPS